MGGLMSHVDFKKWQCRMSLLLIFLNVPYRIQDYDYVPCHYIFSPISHVTKPYVSCDFKKCLCRPADFRGPGPSSKPCYVSDVSFLFYRMIPAGDRIIYRVCRMPISGYSIISICATPPTLQAHCSLCTVSYNLVPFW